MTGSELSSAKNSEGLRLEQTGDYEGAVQAFTEALTLNPESAAAHRNRAEALRRLGREAEAQVDLEKVKAKADLAYLGDVDRRGAEESSGDGGVFRPLILWLMFVGGGWLLLAIFIPDTELGRIAPWFVVAIVALIFAKLSISFRNN